MLEETAGLTTPFVHLSFLAGPYRKREHRVEAPGCTIGASQANPLAMPIDSSVSELHAHLRFYDNAWWLMDAGSAAGTYLLVEDRGRTVAVGDVYRIARTEVQFFVVHSEFDKP